MSIHSLHDEYVNTWSDHAAGNSDLEKTLTNTARVLSEICNISTEGLTTECLAIDQ